MEWGLGDISPSDVLNDMIHDREEERTHKSNTMHTMDAAPEDDNDDFSQLANAEKTIDDDDDGLQKSLTNDGGNNLEEDDSSVHDGANDDEEESKEDGEDGPSFLEDVEDTKEKSDSERPASPSFF